jgi:hypothetical protein
MWQSGFLLMLVAVTSVLAGLLASASGGRQRSLRRAVLLVLEMAGMAALFLAANLALGVVIVLAIRGMSSMFVSIYLLDDVALLGLSILQGAVFCCWRRTRAGQD